MSNIKWAAIQPLTGGMYLGAEEAIGHPAEFILSYPHLADENNNEFNLFFILVNLFNIKLFFFFLFKIIMN